MAGHHGENRFVSQERRSMVSSFGSPAHRYLGTVALPSHFSAHAVKGLSVYGVGVDQDDVESVVIYSVKLGRN